MESIDSTPNYCLWSAVSIALYSALEFYVNRRQIAALKRNEMPKGIEIIKDKWEVKPDEIKQANEYNAESMRLAGWNNLTELAVEIFMMYYNGLPVLW
jgi:hypothetical protein